VFKFARRLSGTAAYYPNRKKGQVGSQRIFEDFPATIGFEDLADLVQVISSQQPNITGQQFSLTIGLADLPNAAGSPLHQLSHIRDGVNRDGVDFVWHGGGLYRRPTGLQSRKLSTPQQLPAAHR